MQTKEKENRTAHSRVLKFRAWDKKRNKLVYLEKQKFERMSSGGWYTASLEELLADNIPIMQFTGLLDKNGKKVFEGDIVKCLDGYNAEVFWDDKHTGWHPFGSYEGAEWDKSVEVIGNIYENSDLLNP